MNLHPVRFTMHPPVAGRDGELLPHLFTFTLRRKEVCFLWHCLPCRFTAETPVSRGTVLAGVRTFLRSCPKRPRSKIIHHRYRHAGHRFPNRDRLASPNLIKQRRSRIKYGMTAFLDSPGDYPGTFNISNIHCYLITQNTAEILPTDNFKYSTAFLPLQRKKDQ